VQLFCSLNGRATIVKALHSDPYHPL
jgi:hypothetical protein